MLAQTGRQGDKDRLRPGSSCSQQVSPHGVRVHLQPLDENGRQRCCLSGDERDLGQHRPLGLPSAAVTFMAGRHSLNEHPGCSARDAREGVKVLTELGVALLRHRDASDRRIIARFA